MSQETSRSEEVVERYKRDKLAASALRKIHDVIAGFEQDRADDARVAKIGIVLLLVLVCIAYFFFSGSEPVRLN